MPKLSENACEEIISRSLGRYYVFYCLCVLKYFLFERCNFKRLLCGGLARGSRERRQGRENGRGGAPGQEPCRPTSRSSRRSPEPEAHLQAQELRVGTDSGRGEEGKAAKDKHMGACWAWKAKTLSFDRGRIGLRGWSVRSTGQPHSRESRSQKSGGLAGWG